MQENATPTATLREEHRLIRLVVDALERLMEGADPAAPPLSDLEDCLTFFRLFTDACHHGKEEDLLFSELEERGMPRDEGPIAVMLHEHRLGRRLVGEMEDILEGLPSAGGNGEGWTRFECAGRDYVELMRAHIGKEDGVLFEWADQMVSGPACARLCARYEEVCSRRFEGRTKEELERLARRLSQ